MLGMGRKRTGQIIQLGESRYKIRIQTKKNGTRGFFGEIVEGSYDDAVAALNICLEKVAELEKHPEKAMTINDLMVDFINSHVRHQVKKRTALDYENILRRYIRPRIGKKLMTEFRVRDAREFYEYLRKVKKISAGTIRKVHFHLKGALTYAVEMEWRETNPLFFIKPPKVTSRSKTQIPSINETLEIFKACRTVSEKALWMTAYFTGMRPEEYLALRWSDIDLEKQTFRIDRVSVQLPGRRPEMEDPKTQKSRRTQPMTDEVKKALNAHRTAWLEMKLVAGRDWGNLDGIKDLVFCTSNGNVILNSNLNRNFRSLIKFANGNDPMFIRRQKWEAARKGVEYEEKKMPQKVRDDISPYSLRHAFASHLMETGATLKDVSDLLAHSSIRLTADTYVHMTDERKTRAVDKLERRVLRKKAG